MNGACMNQYFKEDNKVETQPLKNFQICVFITNQKFQ
jgi:hypothetical protein